MPNKPARSVEEQLQLLKGRGMLFRNESEAIEVLKNVSYYRLKGYWWDMQSNHVTHTFQDGSSFDDVINRYNFDRQLKIILFDAVERIEIALRTKMIYQMSLSYGPIWYKQIDLFVDPKKLQDNIDNLDREFSYSQEIFIRNHKRKYQDQDPEAWKILEIASMGTLSKFYKNLLHQLPEKSQIAKEMGLNLHSELSSWLESINYIRNIIAHHSRLWSRNMVKTPVDQINNPIGNWFDRDLLDVQKKKPFLIISVMVYLCNNVVPENGIKQKIKDLISNNPDIPVYKLGFLNHWIEQPLWRS